MSQAEIFEFLKERYKKNPNKWWTVKEMMKFLNLTKTSINHNLSKLRKTDFIEFKITKNPFKYRYRND
jgi:DNA-binding MarR family transcriptional regulator